MIRVATDDDAPAMGRLAVELVHAHHAFDPLRFAVFDDIERGYEAFLRRELGDREAACVVAEADGVVVGYAYGRLEPRSFVSLLDACAFLHDLYVEAPFRRAGVAAALVEAIARALRALGAPRLLLGVAAKNEAAQGLFEKLGFRPTMIEMTREL